MEGAPQSDEARGKVPNSQFPEVEDHSSRAHVEGYDIPHQSIISVEHPYIILDLDKGVESLGGISKLRLVCQDAFQVMHWC